MLCISAIDLYLNVAATASKKPQRVLLNFMVDDLMSEQQRLEAQGVRFTRPAAEEPGVGLFATLLDPTATTASLSSSVAIDVAHGADAH